jgi:hypothetical protein
LAQRRSAYDGRRLTRVNTHELNEALFFDYTKAEKTPPDLTGEITGVNDDVAS